MIPAEAGVAQGDRGQRGVPHGRLAGFQTPARAARRAHAPGVVAILDHEAVETFQAAAHDRVLDRIAAQVQRHQRVDPGWLDPAP